MCAIYGTYNIKNQLEFFISELNKMQHRGPDGFGVWQSIDKQVFLGHRRLSIIDIDARSNQPMVLNDRYVLVFNGEIYNYIEIREELIKEGIQFHTNSDTEVLLQLIINRGPEALTLMNGVWSFVIYDQLEKTLFLSRDRIGEKPFYYIHNGESFAFSSEMKNLVCYLDHVVYDRAFIDFSIQHVFDAEAREQTIIKGIKKFPPGSYGRFQNGFLSIERFYKPESLPMNSCPYRNFHEAVEEFKYLFQSSCKLRMRSDVPVGSALSGGIDSSFIVSSIAQMGFAKDGSYKALVSSFPGSFLDEKSEAQLTARYAGVPFEAVDVQANLHPDHILQAVYQFEELAATSPIPFFQLYQGFRDRNIVVSLDGHGSDELFGGYTFDLYAKLKDDFPNLLEMRKTVQAIDSMYGFKNNVGLKDTWPYFKMEFIKRMKKKKLHLFFEKEHHYKKQLFHSTFKGILPTLLRNYDKYSMAAGVEVRMPFLDYRIIEFAFSLPNDYRFRNGFTKAIVRRAAKGLVPDAILSKKVKIGWNSPMGEWFAGPWKQWLLDEIASVEFSNCDLIKHKHIKEKISQFFQCKPDQNTGQAIWLQLQPYLIEKANKRFSKKH